MEQTDDMLTRLAESVLAKHVLVPVTGRVPLDQAPDAIRRHQEGGVLGKTILLIS